jgi:hypothetical protein
MQRHLVHVGYPKAGSTTLQAWFESRPEVASWATSAEAIARQVAVTDNAPRWVVTSSESLMVPAFERRLLEAVGADQLSADLPREEHGRHAVHHGVGDAGDEVRRARTARSERDEGPGLPSTEPLAARRRRVCARLRTMFGDATILILTRGFRSIIASSYSEVLRWGSALSVEEVVSVYQESPAFEGWRMADVFDYDAALRLYADTFGAESVVVLPFELLRDDPPGFLARLEQRLDLEPRSEQAPWRNRSLSGAELYWYPRFSRGVERATATLGRPGTALRRTYYERVIRSGRLERSVDVLSRVLGTPTVNPADHIPEEVVETCRGRASSFATNPDYATYAVEYLNDR